jgi:hypothetical protein
VNHSAKGATAARYLVYGVLGTWLAMTFVSQEPTRKFDKLRRWDPTGAFIPDWRFFAPRPGMHDNHLLVRDELPDGGYTPWQEYVQVETRRWQHFFWYPGRRAEKVVTDAVGALNQLQPDLKDSKENVQVSVPYLTLLNYVVHQVPHHPDGKRVQFMIATSAGYDDLEEPTALFLSNTHPLT